MAQRDPGDLSENLASGSNEDQIRHDIKSELHAIKMGVLLIRQIAENSPEEISTILADTGVRIESCVDRITTRVDRAFPKFDADKE